MKPMQGISFDLGTTNAVADFLGDNGRCANRLGTTLHGIFGAKAGQARDYCFYSRGLTGLTWHEAICIHSRKRNHKEGGG